MDLHSCFWLQTRSSSHSQVFPTPSGLQRLFLPVLLPLKISNAAVAPIPPAAAGEPEVGSAAGESLFNHIQAALCVGFLREPQRNAPSRLGPQISPGNSISKSLGVQQQNLWSWCSFPAAFSSEGGVGNSPVLGISFGFCRKLPAEDLPQSRGDNQLGDLQQPGTPSLPPWGSSLARGGGLQLHLLVSLGWWHLLGAFLWHWDGDIS